MSIDVHSFSIMDSNGVIYHLATVPAGGYVMAGDEELIYEEDSINVCRTLTLESGQYRIEIKGGKGAGVDIGTNKTFEGEVVNYDFVADGETVVHLFRGGDGRGDCNGNGVTGGGASGVDSLFVGPNGYAIAHGGNGAPYGCRGYNAGKVIGRNAYTEGLPGGGGYNSEIRGYYNTPLVNSRAGSCMSGIAVIAGGGGGAIAGRCASTSSCTYKTATIAECQADGANCSAGASAGTAATAERGGNGGSAYVTFQDISLSADGGRGGATVSWSCGGQMAYSYGGGGGAALCTGGFLIDSAKHNGFTRDLICIPGQDGSSGSTNSSTTSYIRIFKLG